MNEEAKSVPLDDAAWRAQAEADDREISQLLGASQEGHRDDLAFSSAPFDQSGKADDAEDYEDIGDDDLPDEEEGQPNSSLDIPGLTDDGGTSNDAEDADDLFGEGPSSYTEPILHTPSPEAIPHRPHCEEGGPLSSGLNNQSSINFDPDPHVNGFTNQDPDIPSAAETKKDLIRTAWPAFRKNQTLTWSELLPTKKAFWKAKKPSKKPRHLVTSKQSLEIAGDQEKHFRIPGSGLANKRHIDDIFAVNLIRCKDRVTVDDYYDASLSHLDLEGESDLVHNLSLRDIELACEDWITQIDDVNSKFKTRPIDEVEMYLGRQPDDSEPDDDWDAEFLRDEGEKLFANTTKHQAHHVGLPKIPNHTASSFDLFEETTYRGAKRVLLDLSDPHLLLDADLENPAKRVKVEMRSRASNDDNRTVKLLRRFNVSNDEAYELLKENHQSKVRATLGNISVEHSMPAIKLTWPYYKVKLPGTTDEYHRPRFRYKKFAGLPIKFDKPLHHRRKQMKGKVHEVFSRSKDLSICDNSPAVLFEYSEPRPRVLNNFGMGNRLVNYHRRKDAKDEEQPPKQELGEFSMLLPEDRSPFSMFGTVSAGETVPTLHNEMYRAPVFKHQPRLTDFLIIRNTTGIEGSRWYIHKIDHLHVVGQTFPLVEVPGPHSRKVTNASKNRMKMLAFRMIRHSKTLNCQLSDITKHIADSNDTQNRQKLKEFLQFDRESGEKGMWRLKPGEILPDEMATGAMIKPEEVSLLDAMQLGMKEFEDAGYDPRNASFEDEQLLEADGEENEVDDDASKNAKGSKKVADKQEETFAEKMAPWKTTKAFIDACAQKAMLQLHGEGDPTGHGLGFSFIRTSMKGGYLEAVQGPLATSADAMEREKRANGGHAYNVKKQQAMYEEGIREIWEKQRSTLSAIDEHDEDVALNEDEDDRFDVNTALTPAVFDEGFSQISGMTTSTSRQQKRAIRISRQIRMQDGTTQVIYETVHDPVVILQYMKRRREAESKDNDIYSSRPTGNADHDRLANFRIRKELERLERNKARRQAREQQKELHQKVNAGDGGFCSAEPTDKTPTGTTRKCANCGQVGHIKTNKKLCPLLNGTMNSEQTSLEHGGFGNYSTPTDRAD